MAWEGPVLGAGLRAVLWAIDRYRGYRQGRRKVSVLVHDAFWIDDIGASPLTTPPNANWSVSATGTGGGGVSRYYFMKVANLSADRDIEVTHARFIGAERDFLLTRRQLPVRLAPDKTWEGWLNAATLAHVSNVQFAGRVSITGIRKPIKSRPNKDVPPIGRVADPGSPSDRVAASLADKYRGTSLLLVVATAVSPVRAL